MRRIAALLLCALLAMSLLTLPAAGEVSPEQQVVDGVWRFVVDDAITYHDESILPVEQDDVLYFPVELLLTPLGADYQLDEATRTLSLYRDEQIIAINLITGQAITSDGRFLLTRAVYRSGTYYVSASLVLREFGGRLATLPNNVYRLTTGSQALTDDEIMAIMNCMPSFRPEVVDQPPVYLLFRGAGAGLSRTLTLLSQQGIRATFFFTAGDIERSPATLRRIYISGHRIGIYAESGTTAEVVRANNLLQKVLKLRTSLVYAPADASSALESAGYLVWNSNLSAALESDTLSLSPVLSTVGWTTSVWFGGSAESAQTLERVLASVSELRLRIPSETMRAFRW